MDLAGRLKVTLQGMANHRAEGLRQGISDDRNHTVQAQGHQREGNGVITGIHLEGGRFGTHNFHDLAPVSGGFFGCNNVGEIRGKP